MKVFGSKSGILNMVLSQVFGKFIKLTLPNLLDYMLIKK